MTRSCCARVWCGWWRRTASPSSPRSATAPRSSTPSWHTDEGLRAAVAARGKVAGTPILMLSQYVEVSYADDLLADRRGAIGYLLKDRVSDIAEFLDNLRRVASGGTVLDPEVVAQLLV